MIQNEDEDYALALQLQAEEEDMIQNITSESPRPQQQQNVPSIQHQIFIEESPMGSAARGTFATDSSQREATNSDSRLAAFLQALEFEINDETIENRYTNFEERELSSSSWKKQLRTVSTVICVIQVRSRRKY